jgi:hypothetical protein
LDRVLSGNEERVMKRIVMVSALVVGLSSCALAQQEAPPLKAPQYWYHVMTNLLNNGELDRQIKLMERASAAGYNGITVNDVKLIKYHLQPPAFVENLRRFRQACRDNKVLCIPCVMPMGYAENILAHDPNLAEGMPVRDAVFVV